MKYRKRPLNERKLCTLKIAGQKIDVFRVHTIKGEDTTDGLWDWEESRIYLRSDLAPTYEREVFLHELWHAIVAAYCVPGLSHEREEELADFVGRGMAQALNGFLPKTLFRANTKSSGKPPKSGGEEDE